MKILNVAVSFECEDEDTIERAGQMVVQVMDKVVQYFARQNPDFKVTSIDSEQILPLRTRDDV